MDWAPRSKIVLEIHSEALSPIEFIIDYADKVESDGMFIETPNPVPAGEDISFKFRLRDGQLLFSGKGRVVSSRYQAGGNPGIWVVFEKLSPSGAELIQQILEHQQEADTLIRPVEPELLAVNDSRSDSIPIKLYG